MIESKARKRNDIRNERKIEQNKWKEERKTAIELGLPLPKKPKRKVSNYQDKNQVGY